MKRFLIALSAIVCLWLVYAQNQNAFDIGSVDLNFCDTTNHLALQSDAWTETWFCVILNNISSTTWTIQLHLVDWEMSVGKNPIKACKMTSSWYFGTFVMFSWIAASNQEFVLPPNTVAKKWVQIKIPQWFAWALHWCITYNISHWATTSGMFEIINRKANIIDVVVSGDYVDWFSLLDMNIYTGTDRSLHTWDRKLTKDSPIIISRNSQGIITMVIWLQNTWFATEDFQISWEMYAKHFNRTSFEKSIEIDSGTLYGGDMLIIEHEIEKLPIYGGKYHIQMQISHSPVAETWLRIDIKNPNTIYQDMIVQIPSDMKLMIRICVIVLIMVLLIVWLMIRKNMTRKNNWVRKINTKRISAKKRKSIKKTNTKKRRE